MTAMTPFRNRSEAGTLLAERLRSHSEARDPVLLALPRGGIPVAYAISAALGIPLDIVVVRKLGIPGHEEYAMGAIARGVRVLQREVLEKLRVPASAVEEAVSRELREIERRERLYRDGKPPLALEGKTVILVDDGLATGSSMDAAVQAVRRQEPRKIIVAVPVGAADSCARIAGTADEVICLHTPSPFRAVSLWYEEFEQVDDEEACRLLLRGRQGRAV